MKVAPAPYLFIVVIPEFCNFLMSEQGSTFVQTLLSSSIRTYVLFYIDSSLLENNKNRLK